MGPMAALLQTRQPLLVEGSDDIAYRLGSAAQTTGYRHCPLPSGTRQERLATAQDKGIRGTQPGLQLLALLIRQPSYLYACFHARYYST